MYELQLSTTTETQWLAALAQIKTYLDTLKTRVNQPVSGFLAAQNTGLTPVEVVRLRHLLLISQRLLQAEVLVSSPTASVQLAERLLDMIWLLAKHSYGLADQTLEKALQVLQQKILSSTQIAEADKQLLSVRYNSTIGLIHTQDVLPKNDWSNDADFSRTNLPNFDKTLDALIKHQNAQLIDERYKQEINELEVKFSEHSAVNLINQLHSAVTNNNTLLNDWRNYLAAAHHLGIALQAIGKPDRALSWYARLCQGSSAELMEWLGYYLVRMGELVSGIVPAFQPDWLRYRADLEKHRNQLKHHLQPTDRQHSLKALERFNQDIKSFTRQLWEEAQALCGPQPADLKFCVVSLGSMSRGMMTAYSDVEYALLVGKAEDYPDANPPTAGPNYLRRLLELFEFKVESLGEAEGYHLDPASQPRTEPAVLGTVAQILKGCLSRATEGHDGLVYSLLHPLHLYGDESLFKSYTDELTKALQQPCTKKDASQVRLSLWNAEQPVNWHYYWSMHQFKRNQAEYEKYFVEKKEASDLKKPYVKLLTFIPLDLALYLNLPAHDFAAACKALSAGQYLPAAYLNELQTHLQDLQIARTKQHLQCQKQDETAQSIHQAKLRQIEREILTPFFAALPTLQKKGYVAFQQKLWEIRAQLLLENLLNLEAAQASSTSTAFASYRLITNDKVSAGKLSAVLTQKLFKADGKVQGTTEERNSAYFELNSELCLKLVEPDKFDMDVQVEALNEYLLREYAVSQLAQLLGFAVIPAGCIIQLNHQGKTYYGWLAQKVEGRELGNALTKAPHLIQKLDPISYTQLVLLSLITYPEDGQSRNFMISSQANANGHYRLWSVDNKRNFVEPMQATEFLFFKTGQKLGLKTVLYLLQQAQSVLSQEVFAVCKHQDVHELRKSWLASIESIQQQLDKVPGLKAKREELAKKKDASQTAALELLLLALLERWRLDLVPALDKEHPPTALELLKQFEPVVHTEYQQRIQKIQQTNLSIEYFDKIFEGDYRTNKQGQTFTKTTAEALSKAQVRSQALAKRLFEQNPQCMDVFVWKTMSQHEQLSWLKLLKTFKLQALRLSDCSVLNDEDLQAMLKKSGPSLRVLDISNCAAISAHKVLDWLSNWNINVEEMAMNGLARLEQIIIPARLSKLETISVKNCPNLQLVDGTKVSALQVVNTLSSPLAVVKPESVLSKFEKILAAIHRDDPQLKSSKFKICLLGDLAVGKTAWQNRLSKDIFSSRPSIGVSRKTLVDPENGITYKFNFWKLPSMGDRYLGLMNIYLRDTNLYILFLDITKDYEMQKAHLIKQMQHDFTGPKILVFTKIDLDQWRIIPAATYYEVAKDLGAVTYLECSAKTGENCETVFYEVVKHVLIYHSDYHESKIKSIIDSAKLSSKNQNQLNRIYATAELLETNSSSEVLKVNRTVTQIDLSSNQIGDQGAQALAEALKLNQTVTQINLSGNNIGAAGVQALGEALKVNQTVTQIDLRENNIGAQALAEIKSILKANRARVKAAAAAFVSSSSVADTSSATSTTSTTTEASSSSRSSTKATSVNSASSFFVPATASESTSVDSLHTQTEIQRNYAESLQLQAARSSVDSSADDFDFSTDAELSVTEDAETSATESSTHSPR